MSLKTLKLAVLATAVALPTLAATPVFADGGVGIGNRQSENAGHRQRANNLRDKRAMRRTSGTLDRLLAWNEVMNDANALDHTPSSGFAGDQQGPTRNARAFAIVSIAVFDAVNSFDRRFNSYSTIAAAPRNASQDAAIAQAAFTTLNALHPRQSVRLAQIFSSDISSIRGSAASIAAGRAVGLAAANAILADRATDGAGPAGTSTVVPFGAGGAVGDGTVDVRGNGINSGQTAAPNWTPDPVGLPRGVALGSNWGSLRPFVLTTGNQFRIPNYPTPGSARFTRAFNDVAAEGADPSVPGSTNSASDQFIGNYWGYDGAALLGTPPRLYNQITVKIANGEGLRRVDEYARLLALVNTTMGDSGIAAWDSKYFHNYWRPVTGVRRGAEDGDPATTGNPTWRPFGASVINASVAEAFTPPFPAYPSGHATFGAAMAQSIASIFGNNTRFTFVSDEYNGTGVDPKGDPRPLVPVRYRTLLEAQQENGRSRIFNGVHWEPDDTEGQVLGTNIVRYTLANAFQRRRGH
jgi:PAP2 superfamily